MFSALPFLIAIAIPIVVLYFIWALEIYAFSNRRLLITAFGWGIITFFIAFVVQNTLQRMGILTFQQVSLYSAPLLEEFLKGIFIFWMLQTVRLRYAVDGASYGFAVGTGFAVAENLLYIGEASGTGTALELTIARVLSVSLMHAYNTGVLGAAAGSYAYNSFRVRFTRLSTAFGAVVFVHALFNLLVNTISGFPLILVGILIGLGGTIVIVVLIQRALRMERESLDHVMRSQLSAGERAAAINREELNRVLTQYRDVIGDHRASVIHEYITLQAQRGILRKTLRLNNRPKYDSALQTELDALEIELRHLRNEMGLYTWIWLRSVLPSEESELWSQLGQQLDSKQPVINLLVKLGERQADIDRHEVEARRSLLRQSKLFSEFQEDELDDLALLMREVQYAIGDTVVKRGDVDDRLFVVAAGSLVASVTDAEGNETIITGYSLGDTFGELSMIDLEQYPSTVTCLDDVKLYTLAREDLLTLIFAKPQVGLELMRQLVAQIRRQTSLLMWVRMTSTTEGELMGENPTP